MDDLVIRLYLPEDKERWNNYLVKYNPTNYVAQFTWRDLIQQVYNLPHYWYIAEQQDNICGLLALTHTRHPLLGNYLATAPFDNYGGVYAESNDILQALLDQATQLRIQLNADFVLVRFLQEDLQPPEEWIQDPVYATFILNLDDDPDKFWWDHLNAKQRNQAQKSIEQGFEVKFGRETLYKDFWYVLSLSMRELGSPFHAQQYFYKMMELLGDKMEFVLIYSSDGRPVGGGLIIYDRKNATLYYANVLNAFRPQCAGDFLYWSVIKRCIINGINQFEMGRSLIKTGNEHFKMKWRPVRKILNYWYNLRPKSSLPHLNQSNPKYKLAIWLWQRMPLVLTRAIGPYLITGIL